MLNDWQVNLVIGQLTMPQLHILHCTFRFYNCTSCDQLYTEICPWYRISQHYGRLLLGGYVDDYIKMIRRVEGLASISVINQTVNFKFPEIQSTLAHSGCKHEAF